MTNEEAIKWLGYSKQGEVGKAVEALDMAIKALEQTTWIPVSERLPEENETVLINYCRLNEHSVRMAIWDELHCRFYNSEYTKYVSVDFVTAWMPLPEPYKGE